MAQEDLNNQKQIEFYAAGANAWFNSSLEHDKSLLALSAGGIGLLITLLTTIGLHSVVELVLYCGAIINFVVTVISTLRIFRLNQTYLVKILKEQNVGSDPVLSRYDLIAQWTFGIGAVFTAFIGISAAIHSYTLKENVMAPNSKKSPGTVSVGDSFNGANNLQPGADFTRSFNGAGNLQPQSGSGIPNSSAPRQLHHLIRAQAQSLPTQTKVKVERSELLPTHEEH